MYSLTNVFVEFHVVGRDNWSHAEWFNTGESERAKRLLRPSGMVKDTTSSTHITLLVDLAPVESFRASLTIVHDGMQL